MRKRYSEVDLKSLIARALAEDSDALGELLEHYRPILAKMAREQLGDEIQGRVGESDIIQQSCRSAVRTIGNFRGSEPGEFLAWLKTIHDNNIRNTIREHTVQKRDFKREERPVTAEQPASVPQKTASQAAMTKEAVVSLQQAIDQLPEDQRTAVTLKHLDGFGITQIATKMNRSNTTVAGLLKRGIATLRGVLKDNAEQS